MGEDEGDEGSCELSDEVSRDSTMGSDSDTFSSPFCLSPVSETLCESSGSVFLDSENRSVRVEMRFTLHYLLVLLFYMLFTGENIGPPFTSVVALPLLHILPKMLMK